MCPDEKRFNKCNGKPSNDGKIIFLCYYPYSDGVPHCMTKDGDKVVTNDKRGKNSCDSFVGQLPPRTESNACFNFNSSSKENSKDILLPQINNCTSQCFKSLPVFKDVSQDLCPSLTSAQKFYSSCCSLGGSRVLYANQFSFIDFV